MRMLIVSSAFLAMASAFLLYGLNYETRRIEVGLHALERAAEKSKTDISILRAERAHLARPERIEPLARSLGLVPAGRDQLAATSDEDLAAGR